MSERVYDRLANVFVLVAVGSALLFNAASPWHWVVGGLGAAAGVGAIILYFKNQSRTMDERPNVATEDDILEGAGAAHRENPLTVSENWVVGRGSKAVEQYVKAAYLLHGPKAVRFYEHRNLVQSRAVNVYWHTYHEAVMQMAEQRKEITLSTEQIASCAIEIIRTLSSGEDRDRWEFNFGAKGLRVCPAKGIEDGGSIEDQSSISEAEFEYGQVPTTIQ